MKNKIREKIVASIMLSAFAVTNSFAVSFAVNDMYGYGEYPSLRTDQYSTAANVKEGLQINNADSVVNLSLRDADIKQVLRMFADQAGMNIIFSSNVDGTVTMDLVDIPLSEALSLVVNTHNLFYDIQANTLVVSNKDEAISVSQKAMTVVPVKYVNANALANFLNTNIFNKDGVNPGLSTKPVVTTNPATNELIVMGTSNDVDMVRKIVDQFDKKPRITTFKVNHTTPAEMADVICNSLLPATASASSDSSGATGFAAGIPTGFASDSDDDSSGRSSSSRGSDSSGITVGGGKLVCSIEATGPSASGLAGLSFKNLSVSYFPTQGTVQVIGGSDTQIDMIREYIAINDRKTPQAYMEIQIISLSESGSKTFDNTWQFLSKNFSFNAGGGQGFQTVPQLPVFFAGRGYSSIDNPRPSAENPASIHKWSTSPQLVYSVQYLIENSKGRVLANPRILMTSGQTSVIDLTSDYVSKVTSQYLDNGSSSGTAQVQKDYEISDDNGIKISVTPFISPDGYVTLDIKPDYASIAEKLYAIGETGDQDLAATLLQRRNLDLRGIRIKDGETLVVGGMIQETENKTVSKIPFLGDIPVLGMFFRSTTTEKAKEEMVIMLTPQIVVDTEDAVANETL